VFKLLRQEGLSTTRKSAFEDVLVISRRSGVRKAISKKGQDWNSANRCPESWKREILIKQGGSLERGSRNDKKARVVRRLKVRGPWVKLEF